MLIKKGGILRDIDPSCLEIYIAKGFALVKPKGVKAEK